MSENRDKPTEPDPDATVTIQRNDLAAPPDDDATVTLQRSSLPSAPDEDATVMMKPPRPPVAPDEDATVMMKPPKPPVAPDEDATVMMKPPKPPVAPDEDATVMMKPPKPPVAPDEDATVIGVPRGAPPESDPDATVIGGRLSPPPAPEAAPVPAANIPASNIPWNAIAGGLVVLLVVLYFVFSGRKEPAPSAPTPEVAATPAAAPAPAPVVQAAAPAAPVAAPSAPAAATPGPAAASSAYDSVKKLLASEIERGLIAVTQEGGVTSIALRETHQFDAGGVDPEDKVRPVLLRIAAVLDKLPGAIVVTGHADSTPSAHKRYASNKELSAARAESAAKVMAAKLADPKRLTSEGASDAQPLVPNDTAENRAKNRRIVIVLKPAA